MKNRKKNGEYNDIVTRLIAGSKKINHEKPQEEKRTENTLTQ